MNNQIKSIQVISETEQAMRDYSMGMLKGKEYQRIIDALAAKWKTFNLSPKERRYALDLLAESHNNIKRFVNKLEKKLCINNKE